MHQRREDVTKSVVNRVWTAWLQLPTNVRYCATVLIWMRYNLLRAWPFFHNNWADHDRHLADTKEYAFTDLQRASWLWTAANQCTCCVQRTPGQPITSFKSYSWPMWPRCASWHTGQSSFDTLKLWCGPCDVCLQKGTADLRRQNSTWAPEFKGDGARKEMRQVRT